MTTYIIQIGNTDDKLTQVKWSEFVRRVNDNVNAVAPGKVHFFGGSSNWERWQNCCWVFEPDPRHLVEFLDDLKLLRALYFQDSVAVTVGETTFL